MEQEGQIIQNAEPEEQTCGICAATVSIRGVLDCCNHMFCFPCIDSWATVTNLCPMCKAQFKFVTLLRGDVSEASKENDEKKDAVAPAAEEKGSYEEASTYFIDEEAILCLDGEKCKVRFKNAAEEDWQDTSVACDLCDRWYHACCVGFDPLNSNAKHWHCPSCISDAMATADQKESLNIDNVVPMSFSFMENGESAIVISMVSDNEVPKATIQSEENLQEDSHLPFFPPEEQLYSPTPSTPVIHRNNNLDVSIECDTHLEKEQDEDDPKKIQLDFRQMIMDTSAYNLGPEDSFDDEPDSSVRKEIAEHLHPKLEDIFVKPPVDADEEVLEEFMADDSCQEEPTCDPETKTEQTLLDIIADLNDKKYIESLLRKAKIESGDEETVDEDDTTSRHDSPKKSNDTGIRTRIIMKRDNEQEKSVVDQVRLQMRRATGHGADEDLGDVSVSDEAFLSAFKAAIKKSSVSKIKKGASFGAARENLKRKLYGGLRGRRVYDRDWDVAFWKDRVQDKKLKSEEQGSLRTDYENVLTGFTSQPADSILDRLYVADTSLMPRKDDIRPVSQPTIKKRVALQPKEVSDKVQSKAEESTTSAATIESAGPPKDKRQWALELLARKNKKAVSKDDTKSSGKGGFDLLVKLPAEMRPILEHNPRSKVPTAVRQMQLHRLMEQALKGKEIGKNPECEAAVNAAIAKEKELFVKSNSRGVYTNLCVIALSQGEYTGKCKAEEEPNDDIARALLATGLVSDSPPASPQKDPPHKSAVPEDEAIPSSKRIKLTETNSAPASPHLVTSFYCEPTVSSDEANKDAQDKTEPPKLEKEGSSLEKVQLKTQLRREDDEKELVKAEADKSQVCSRKEEVEAVNEKDTVTVLKDESKTVAEHRRASVIEEQRKSDRVERKETDECRKDVARDRVAKAPPEGRAETTERRRSVAESEDRILEQRKSVERDRFRQQRKEECKDGERDKNQITAELRNRGSSQEQKNNKGRYSKQDSKSFTERRKEAAEKDKMRSSSHEKLKSKDSRDSRIEYSKSRVKVEHQQQKNASGQKEEELRDEKFMALDNRIEKMRSSVLQQLGGGVCNSMLPSTAADDDDDELKDSSKAKPEEDTTIKKQVEIYVKEHIRPLCKSGVITAEQYQWTVSKTTCKVLQHHKHASNADFLISEGAKVKKLSEQYLQRYAHENNKNSKS